MTDINDFNQIVSGIEYSKRLLNTLNIQGVDNYEKILAVYHNLDVIIQMITSNEITKTQEPSDNFKKEE